MTLLEALAALVILGTTAVGFLEVFHGAARVTRDAADWARLTAYAESVMEETKLGATESERRQAPPGSAARVETRAWSPGVTEVIVVVTASTGRRLELHRLTREPTGAARGGAPR